MRISVLQHVPFEGPARIAHWARSRGHELHISHLYAGDALPHPDAFDRLVVMGGPMGVGDEADHSWLHPEKGCIADAIAAGRSVVGICLGAQLIAEVLGARVYRNPVKEIGWMPVFLTAAGQAEALTATLPPELTVFHWHGDTFDLPPGAVHLAESDGCIHQAFLHDGRVLGLQFHLESTPESVDALCTHCADEIVPDAYVQDAGTMRSVDPAVYAAIDAALMELLDRLPTGAGTAGSAAD
jgi:GMP synthase-like glutamine amidotransferase